MSSEDFLLQLLDEPLEQSKQNIDLLPPAPAKPSPFWHQWKSWLRETMEVAYSKDYSSDIMDDLEIYNSKNGLPTIDYLNAELVPENRQILLFWLSDVMLDLKTEFSVFFIAVYLLDKYNSIKNVPVFRFQWTGLVCLWIADKMVSVEPHGVFRYQAMVPTGLNVDFPEEERNILEAINYELPVYSLLSYFPLPFQLNFSTQLSYSLIEQFQTFCHFICYAAYTDYFTAAHYRHEDIAFCVFVIAAQNHYDNRKYIDFDQLTPEQKVLYNRIKVKLNALVKNRNHPLTTIYEKKWNLFFYQYSSKPFSFK